MDQPTLALKHYGGTLEVQIGDAHRLYVNPAQEYPDRRPENADVIVSFLPPLPTATHDRILQEALSSTMIGFETYGTGETHYVLGDAIDRHWKAERARASEVAWKVPGTGAGITRLGTTPIEVGPHRITHRPLALRNRVYGAGFIIGDIAFSYASLTEPVHTQFALERSDCAVLVPGDDGLSKEALHHVLTHHEARWLYLAGFGLRKAELEALRSALPPEIADRVVARSGKWKLPAA